jgi:HSP20 family protein
VARIFFDRRDPGDEARRIVDLLEGGAPPATAGECTPPLDVIETADTMEIVVDLPGVQADAIQVIFARNTLVVTGQKIPRSCQHSEAGFHLAERAFGRFARAVRMNAAYDAGAATATLSAGELRIVLPRVDERRGSEIRIPVRAN